MDGRRFDNLVRTLAVRGSRRTFVRGLLGFGAAAGAVAVREASGDARTLRTRNTVTTSPPAGCADGAQYCGGVCCSDDQTCCNQSCCSGTCQDDVCCPAGTTNCGAHCCDSSTVCCGSVCCGSADLCSESGTRCCETGTSVCGEECCPAGWDCCDGECCNGTCFGEELCCPASREVCGAGCCAEGETCCGGVCCAGSCLADGVTCCLSSVSEACGDDCCDVATESCCSIDGCCAGNCYANGASCCVAGAGEICNDDCCDIAAEECCSVDGCCAGTCYANGESCCAAGSGEICNDDCCDIAAEECCSVDGCCAGTCYANGESCCATGSGEICGDDCCDTVTEQCCLGDQGESVCVPLEGGCCRVGQCSGDEGCEGICNLASSTCDYPGPDTLCGAKTCSQENDATLSYACNGQGVCETSSTSCEGYDCLDGDCQIPCSVEASDCPGGLCLEEEGVCCPESRTCNFDIEPFCCPFDPAHPGYACCPAGGGCCDCFNDRGVFFCCGQNNTALCEDLDGDWSKDICISNAYYSCVEGNMEIKTRVCDENVVCDVPCCGGVNINSGPGGQCCADGMECSAGVCVPAGRTCTRTGDTHDCDAPEQCADAGTGEGICCPAHRAYRNELAEESGAPAPYWQCCRPDEESVPSFGGDPFCRGVPDFTETSIKSWSRR